MVKALCTEATAPESEVEEEYIKLERSPTAEEDDKNEPIDGGTVSNATRSILLEDDTSFKPIYGIGYWNDPAYNDNPCASVATLSFTGIDKLSDFTINIVGDSCIEYRVVWPEPLTVSTTLHRMWLDGKGHHTKLTDYHGMVKCFDRMMAPLRRHDNRIETTARIPLNMKVESRVATHLLAFPNSTARVIYVVLRGPARKVTNLEDQDIPWEQ